MRSWTVVLPWVLGLTAGVPARVSAQESLSRDVRVLALRSLRAGQVVRVVGPAFGMRTGPVIGVTGGMFLLGGARGTDSLSVSGIDSVWIRKGHARAGWLVGGLVGTVVGIAVLSHQSCAIGDIGCEFGAVFEGAGITLAGALVGAGIGSAVPDWKRRYP